MTMDERGLYRLKDVSCPTCLYACLPALRHCPHHKNKPDTFGSNKMVQFAKTKERKNHYDTGRVKAVGLLTPTLLTDLRLKKPQD